MIKTGDKSLDKWLSFFFKDKKTNTQFIKLLKNTDKYFLTVSPPQSVEEFEIPDNGLLEMDFRKIAFSNDPKDPTEKTRLILAIANNVNLKPWLTIYKETFYEVIEKCFIEGDYEKYGVEFEKVLKVAIEKGYIEKEEFMGVSLLRGMLLASRYDTPEKEKLLAKEIKKNKIKIFLGV